MIEHRIYRSPERILGSSPLVLFENVIPGTTIRISSEEGSNAARMADSVWAPVDPFYPIPEPDAAGFQAPGEITEVT